MASKLQALRDRVKAKAASVRHQTRMGVTALEATVTAGALGYVHGRRIVGDENFKVAGIPVDLAIGIGAGGFSLASGNKRGSEDLLAAGIGGLCSYASRTGQQMGAEAKAEADKADGNRTAGALPQRRANPYATLAVVPRAAVTSG